MKIIVVAFATSVAFVLGARIGILDAVLIILMQVSIMGIAFLFLTDGPE